MRLVCGSCCRRRRPDVFRVGMAWTFTLVSGDDGQVIFLPENKKMPVDIDHHEYQPYVSCAWCGNKLLMPVSWLKHEEDSVGIELNSIKRTPVCLACGSTEMFHVVGRIEFLVFKNGLQVAVQHFIEDNVDKTDTQAVQLVNDMLNGRPQAGTYPVCGACGSNKVDLPPTGGAQIFDEGQYIRAIT